MSSRGSETTVAIYVLDASSPPNRRVPRNDMIKTVNKKYTLIQAVIILYLMIDLPVKPFAKELTWDLWVVGKEWELRVG